MLRLNRTRMNLLSIGQQLHNSFSFFVHSLWFAVLNHAHLMEAKLMTEEAAKGDYLRIFKVQMVMFFMGLVFFLYLFYGLTSCSASKNFRCWEVNWPSKFWISLVTSPDLRRFIPFLFVLTIIILGIFLLRKYSKYPDNPIRIIVLSIFNFLFISFLLFMSLIIATNLIDMLAPLIPFNEVFSGWLPYFAAFFVLSAYLFYKIIRAAQ